MSELREIAERLVDVSADAGADDAVAEAVESTVQQVRFSNSQIDAVNSWNEEHVMLFVAVGKRILSSDLRDMRNLEKLARALAESARTSPSSKNYGGIASGRFKYKMCQADKRIVKLDDPARFAHEAIEGAESAGANNVGGTLHVRHERTGIASTGGARADDESSSLDLSVRAFSQPEASGHAVCCASRLREMNAAETGERAGELSVMARNPVQGEEGRFDLVVEPLFLGVLLNQVSRMMSALRVEIGTSMFAKKLGKRVASEEVTLMDDPTVESISRRSFDHEGVPTRRNVVMKDGILRTYLHNSSTAKRFGTKTTANAGPMIPTPFTVSAQPVPFHPIVAPGDWKVEEMISETKHGLYLNNTWYTRYQNYATGDFSTIPRDAILKIENGKIVGAIKNIRVSDDMTNLLKSIDALSRDAQEVYWWDEASPPSTVPATRTRGITITRSA
ncbi:MAG: TldD/PmbA family protein [Thermoplasmata archaeon]